MQIPLYKKSVDFIKKHKLQPMVDVLIFVIIIVFFHQLWRAWGLKQFSVKYLEYKKLEDIMVYLVFVPSSWIVENIINYDIRTLNTTLYFPNNGYVAVDGGCSGLKQFYQWIFLMILFPGPWKKKLWYIPLGLIVIHLTNIFRIVTLSVIVMEWPQYWTFSHDWILRPFFYVVIFVMWVIWVEKFRYKKKKQVANKSV